MATIIACDSACDLSPEIVNQNNIKIIPLNVILGDKNYKDGVDITPDDIYEYHEKHGVLPKTAAINAAEFEDELTSFTQNGDSVVLFTISSKMSVTNLNAKMAAEEIGNVYVVDSANLSTGIGLLLLEACRMAKEGMDAEAIANECRELTKYVDASFVIDSLEYLSKGGRCSALAALGANLLKIKPMIQVKDGSMGVTKKYRGKYENVLTEYVADKLANKDDIRTENVFVTHAGVDESVVKAVCEQIASTMDFKNLYITRAGSTVSSHCGRNTLGVLFIRNNAL